MTEQPCMERLDGLAPGLTLRCTLPAGHHSAHQDGQLGKTIHWTQNNVWSTGRVA